MCRRVLLLLTVVIAVLPFLLFSTLASARGAEVERARVLGYGEEIGRTVGLSIETAGYCLGNPKPRVDHLKVIEHGASGKWPRGYVVVTAFVIYEKSREAEEAEGRLPCKGLGDTLVKHFKLRRTAAGLPILDGSRRPYKRVPLLEPL
jgi:hypothetical protein